MNYRNTDNVNEKNENILVVDDMETMLRSIRSGLMDLGYKNIVTKKNGSTGLAHMSKEKVDLVISDWKMPMMDGLEFVEKIRSNDEFNNIPFLMATGEDDIAQVKRAIVAGASDFLIKPFTFLRVKKIGKII
jgi:response regulator RpfG family c-di-GMP phosphodiesterase